MNFNLPVSVQTLLTDFSPTQCEYVFSVPVAGGYVCAIYFKRWNLYWRKKKDHKSWWIGLKGCKGIVREVVDDNKITKDWDGREICTEQIWEKWVGFCT